MPTPSSAQTSKPNKAKRGRRQKRVLEQAPREQELAQQAASASSESEHASELADEEPVDCDLEFYDPTAADFNGLRDLLQSLLDGTDFAVGELADVIIKQARPSPFFLSWTLLC